MLWERGRRSSNIEDRRGEAGGLGRGFPFPGGGRLPGPGLGRATRGGGKIGGLGLIVIVLIALFLGVDPGMLLGPGGPGPQVQLDQPAGGGAPVPGTPEEERLKEFVAVVLADTEDTWNPIFTQLGQTYEEPRLVLFRDRVQSACGFASAATGPFYCPGDRKVYLDLGFFDELAQRFRAAGDFAQAYVIAHEVGHHVQTLLGISQKVHEYRRQAGEVDANRASVMLELQADCLAGVWAHHADRVRGVLEPGDIEEALNAASAIGDDRLQRQGRGYVNPDSFTHGSSEQRVRWFETGFASGDLRRCDTFSASRL